MGTPALQNLAELLRLRAAERPDALAYRFLPDGEDAAAETITYGELDVRARALGAALAGRGAAGERALLLLPPGLEYLEALFGCLYAGAVAVPAYPPRLDRPMDRVRALAGDARARFAVTTPAVHRRLERHLAREPGLAGLSWLLSGSAGAAPAGFEPAAPPAEALALLQYTSGSTRAPRGVMLSHRNLLHNAGLLLAAIDARPEDREVSWLPPYHDMGLIGAILAPLLAGGESTLLPPGAFLQRPARWLRAIGRYGATVTGAPDFAWDLCVRRIPAAERDGLDLRSLRVAFSGAERVRPETLDRFAAAFAPAGFDRAAFAPCYGLAEATLAVAFGPVREPPRVTAFDEGALAAARVAPAAPGAAARRLASSGTPLAGVEVAVVDPTSRVRAAPDAIAELWVRGESVAAGYYGQPELTAETFAARIRGEDPRPWLRTGDLGFLADGRLYVAGRLKDLIVVGGVNLHPEDLEGAALDAHPRLRPPGGAAFGVEVEGEERVVLVLEVDDRRDLPAAEIAAAVQGALADAFELQLHELVLVAPGGVPRTSSGKVRRALCRERWLAGALVPLARAGRAAYAAGTATPAPATAPAPAPATAPATATAEPAPDPAAVETIRALAAELLGLPRVGPDDDFFALGGHSLLATQLLSRLRGALGVELPVRAVFEAPTPRGLAARAAAAGAGPPLPPVERVARGGPLALSPSQERMWYLHQLDPGGAAYNVAAAIELAGPLSPALLARALRRAADRHEVLRTRFPAEDGVPRAVVDVPAPLALEEVDVSGAPHPVAEAARRAGDLAEEPFDVARGPLARARLFRTAPDRHVLAASLHHLVADGWSLGVLLSEVLASYEALAAGRDEPPGAPPAVEYADYAAWQRRLVAGPALDAATTYWRRQLEGAPVLELPTSRPRPARPSSRGAFEPLELPEPLLAGVRALARAEGATPFMVMLAAFEVVLHRWSGQADVVIGAPIANRNRLAAEGLVGTLVNTLPLRVRIDPDAPFTALVRAVRECSLEGHAHQDVPFERIVSALRPERRPGRSPFFGVMFDYLNVPMPAREAAGVRVRPLVLSRGASQFDLSLQILDTGLGWLAGAEYATDVLDASAVRRLLGHYRAVLGAAVAEPSRPLARLPILAPGERAALVARARAACEGAPPAGPVVARFEAQAARTPGAIAVVDAAGALDYRGLDEAANALAHRLVAAGAGPGRRVAIWLERSRLVPVALLAVLKSGAAYVPVDPRHPVERVGYVLDDADPAAVITEPALRARLPAPPGAAILTLDPEALPRAPAPPAAPAHDPERPVYVIYTSGSTGRPKGVEIPDRALAAFLAAMERAPGLAAHDRLLSVTTIGFDIAALELFLPLVGGARVELAPADVAADGVRLAALLERSGATVMQATPSTWRMLVETGWRGDGRLVALCGGEPLGRDLADALLARAGAVWNLYGPTETTVWSSAHRVCPGVGPVPIGQPIAHTSIHVLDPHGEPAPVGVAGELFIGGAGVALGYFRRPGLTAERFVPDPFGPPGARLYRTGDAGRLREDGELEVFGRLDHQLKIRGHRVEPGEIEAVLREHPAVADAVVVAREERPGDLRLVAYLAERAGARAEPAELQALCRRRLPDHMVPGRVVALPELPRSPNGKVDRAALPAPDPLQRAEAGRAPPRDALEADVAALFEEALGVRVTSVRDGFFELGGHSLLAARLFARLERRTGVALPLATLLERPTVEGLAAAVRERRARVGGDAPPPGAVVPLGAGGARPPLFVVHGAGGHVLNLHDLARHLGPAQPVYGLQARGVDGRSEPRGRVEEMAEAYLAELRAVRPRGPYHLAGYCGGGLVAWEMARRLREAGDEIALLALVDLSCPGVRPPDQPRARRWLRTLAAEPPGMVLARAARKVARDLGTLARRGRIRLRRALGLPVPHDLREDWLVRAFLRAAARYAPPPYGGRVHVFRARDAVHHGAAAGPDLGWGAFAAEVVSHDVPGDHHTLTREPNVEVLAAVLGAALRAHPDRAAAEPGPAAQRRLAGLAAPARG